ncbi:unnamed protein product [Phaeothamnion confervicola]
MAAHAEAEAALEDKQQEAAAIRAFEKHDVDGNAFITLDELQALAQYMGLPVGEEEVDELMILMDRDGNDHLDKEEWTTWWVERARGNPNSAKQQEVVAANAFALTDKDCSGFVDVAELANLCDDLGLPLEGDEVEEAMRALDRDGNSRLDKTEFVRWWVDRSTNASGALAKKLARLADAGRRMMHTDVHAAAWAGDVALLRGFLDADARLANAPDTTEFGSHWRPLHYAAYQAREARCRNHLGHVEVCHALLTAGAKPLAANKSGCTALFYAAQQGRLEVVNLLLDAVSLCV